MDPSLELAGCQVVLPCVEVAAKEELLAINMKCEENDEIAARPAGEEGELNGMPLNFPGAKDLPKLLRIVLRSNTYEVFQLLRTMCSTSK